MNQHSFGQSISDVEITRLCAEAMGWHTGKLASNVVAYDVSESAIIAGNDAGGESVWQPLHDDAQAMALVKKFQLAVYRYNGLWAAEKGSGKSIDRPDLNRAICECVANLHRSIERE